MSHPRFVAVLDVGKTNAKAVLVDGLSGTEVAGRTVPNAVRQDGPYPHYDVARLEAFFIDALADLARGPDPVDGIAITAHGASGALIHGDGLALPVLDYEFAGPDRLAAQYDAVRPPFAETFSPRLPGGLNLGAQLFWQANMFPERFGTATILTYPQYWAWWLTGVAATEATSLGTHTDLWAPRRGEFSSLVHSQGWRSRMAPLRSAFDVLGPVRPALATRIGFNGPMPVACGLHDSNASLLPHIQGATGALAVVSTGTWVISFAVGSALDELDATPDTLANVDAYGRPVPSARYMGGREFDLMTGHDVVMPDAACVADILHRAVMALPSFALGSGPFPSGIGRWTVEAAGLTPAQRTAVASFYAALMTATCLRAVAASGPTVIEGPFARNALFCEALGVLTGRPAEPSSGGTGTGIGAARLLVPAAGKITPARSRAPSASLLPPGELFPRYAAAWRRQAGQPS